MFFSGSQEDHRKHIERDFRVLQVTFNINAICNLMWLTLDMHSILNARIILHNMAVNERIPLVKLSAKERIVWSGIMASEAVNCCFVPETSVNCPINGNIASLSLTHQYLHMPYEFIVLHEKIKFRVGCVRMNK